LKYRGRAAANKADESKKKITIEKGAKLKFEHLQADEQLDKTELNPEFGFRCLHYSISEAAGTL
jgi:hypothetical protein